MRGCTLWFTGLSSSGKTTVADRVAEILREMGRQVERLDGDVVRKNLTSDLGFSKKDREENIRRVTYVAKLLTSHGVVVLASFISPYQEMRRIAREEIGNFIEIYVRCPLAICIARDTKGLYYKAKQRKIENFTGISAPYEEPQDPEILLETNKETLEASARKVIEYLKKEGLNE